MTQQIINVGTKAGDGTGTPIRTAFTYINENFTELYASVNVLLSNVAVLNTQVGTLLTHEVGIDYGTLGPLISDYGSITDPVTTIIDYGSI